MNAHKLKVLLVVAVVAVALALWSTQVRQPLEESVTGGVALPGLLGQLVAADSLSISGGSGEPLQIERSGDSWGVVQRHGFAADMEKLREYLTKLADARLVEPKTANPGNYVQLGVEDPAAADASGVLVTIRGADFEQALIIGRYNGQGSGTFVRRPDEAQSWLVNADLTANRDPTHWLRREIVDLPSSQVRRLELLRGDGERIRAEKTDEADAALAVADIPAGRELTSEFAASGLAGFLASLRLDDVRPAAEVAVPEDAHTLTYDTFDGRRYSMRIWDEDGRYLLTLAAEMLEPAASPLSAAADDSVDAGDVTLEDAAAEGEPAAPEIEDSAPGIDAAAAVADLNALADGWVFQIPGFKWSAVNKRMEDLLKPVGD
jgi:hypothetical protein